MKCEQEHMMRVNGKQTGITHVHPRQELEKVRVFMLFFGPVYALSEVRGDLGREYPATEHRCVRLVNVCQRAPCALSCSSSVSEEKVQSLWVNAKCQFSVNQGL